MKQLFRDQIPAQFAKELADVRFVKLSNGPFGGQVIAKGDDPRVVDAGGQDEFNFWQEQNKPAPSAAGTLYRIDEREP